MATFSGRLHCSLQAVACCHSFGSQISGCSGHTSQRSGATQSSRNVRSAFPALGRGTANHLLRIKCTHRNPRRSLLLNFITKAKLRISTFAAIHMQILCPHLSLMVHGVICCFCFVFGLTCMRCKRFRRLQQSRAPVTCDSRVNRWEWLTAMSLKILTYPSHARYCTAQARKFNCRNSHKKGLCVHTDSA
jgi:hypothetical protein